MGEPGAAGGSGGRCQGIGGEPPRGEEADWVYLWISSISALSVLHYPERESWQLAGQSSALKSRPTPVLEHTPSRAAAHHLPSISMRTQGVDRETEDQTCP